MSDSSLSKQSPSIRTLCGAGKIVARLLEGAWRDSSTVPEVALSELEAVADLLLGKGCAGLAWWRLRNSDLKNSPAALRLRDGYRLHTLQTAMREQQVVEAFKYLRSQSIEPLLAKGWAVGRLYPQRGLRPYGDLDICVQPHQRGRAVAALSEFSASECPIELHRAFRELADVSVAELFERSETVPLHDTEIRILSPEHHLRLLGLHSLHHGLWRPLWVCDLGVVLESCSTSFDWQLCMGSDLWRAEGLRCSLRLARELLGASPEGGPPDLSAQPLPHWLIPATLREWGAPEHYMSGPAVHELLLRPRSLLKALRLRWPNPIRATFNLRAPYSRFPRLPFQLAECLLRTVRFLGKIPRLIALAIR